MEELYELSLRLKILLNIISVTGFATYSEIDEIIVSDNRRNYLYRLYYPNVN